MSSGIRIVFVLILPWLIFAGDDYERHLWPSVQSVSALIKRYEGALRFVAGISRIGVRRHPSAGCIKPLLTVIQHKRYFESKKKADAVSCYFDLSGKFADILVHRT